MAMELNALEKESAIAELDEAFKKQRKMEDDPDLCVLYAKNYIVMDAESIIRQFDKPSMELLLKMSTMLHAYENESGQAISNGLDALWEVMQYIIEMRGEANG